MVAPVDISGKRFGLLVAINDVGTRGGKRLWLFKCDCGNEKIAVGSDVARGRFVESRSCGCLGKEQLVVRVKKHGLFGHPFYKSWESMIQRCTNPNSAGYSRYGGRGIAVCDRWRDFKNFLADMGDSYMPTLSIDRLDVNGNYDPSNCTWASKKAQANNRRSNRIVEINGESKTLREWCETSGINEATASGRLNRGWDPILAIFKPSRTYKRT